ncbi:MAG: hypothetical protein ACLQPH_04420 [Acidimicrobiales bacterium]
MYAYETVGSTETVEKSLRLLTTAGMLVIGGMEPLGRFEWTPLYFKPTPLLLSMGRPDRPARPIR